MAVCSSCGADIVWAVTIPGGKRIPLDPQPRDDGNLVLAAHDGEGLAVRYLKKADPAPDPDIRRVAHFATCPHAKGHRR